MLGKLGKMTKQRPKTTISVPELQREMTLKRCGKQEAEMSKVRVLVGTRKGAFILNSDGKRKDWAVSGPFFAGWEVFHLKGSPVAPDRSGSEVLPRHPVRSQDRTFPDENLSAPRPRPAHRS